MYGGYTENLDILNVFIVQIRKLVPDKNNREKIHKKTDLFHLYPGQFNLIDHLDPTSLFTVI